MLKVRLMGTKNDIAWFQKILQRHPKLKLWNYRNFIPIKGRANIIELMLKLKKVM